MTRPITVVIVDDDFIVRDSLMSLLNATSGIHPVAAFGNGDHAIRYASEHSADVYLVDLAIGETNGYDTTAQLHSISPSSSIVILTNSSSASAEIAVSALGASAYLRKTANPSAIVSTIQNLGRRITNSSEPPPGTEDRLFPVAELTEREHQVLTLLGHGLSNREIEENLFLSSSAIKKHMSALFKKFETQSRLEVVVKAAELGMIRLATLRDWSSDDKRES
ncbi:response regulator transcription factor [Acidipropionibacterium jensenii]|uniref:Response regulator uvrY n=1 Tax=Acidipropionibacterium jensenii TaxID=1749 RepID=A0A3S4V5T4_9ACTN|nr:response regulator transcription factor [Acidipropionibacterium jensenii]MDN5976300.1 response regulator transcription factor [Acidipropionibacterium jensenii]MDN5995386.1 response regulator transcription factor [Acidipropionibacterium jensenii]MDN6425742.1 response regulator transcription factor [Acidipropionibacterium jensenii]MDN6440540.1 response regulator transcription factor [Acidipropionibacterium jensenii]MDN6479185.1 response regulator transcription factor [Acidipropionibacterium j